ncbi:MAG: hypothetical protein U1F33_13635 [Alphaproteobacteria bacterium]
MRNGRSAPAAASLPGLTSEHSKPSIYRQLHEIRESLHRDANDPLLWIDLALLYTTLGQYRPAMRSMNAALALAPNSRLAIRCATRMYVHYGELDRALSLLRRNEKTEADPWLISAEIATAEIGQRKPKFVRQAQRLVETYASTPGFLTELAGTLATTFGKAGNRKAAKRLLQVSLLEPNDNSIAQAFWMQRSLPNLIQPHKSLLLYDRVYEARALQTFEEGRWNDALANSISWLDDEPYSTRPAILGSFIASTFLRDFKQADAIARRGLSANPDDIFLLNNHAYALANLGLFPEAETIVLSFPRSFAQSPEYSTLLATRGLIAFKRGDIDFGRKCYETALFASSKRTDALTWRAFHCLHYALAELESLTPAWENLLRLFRATDLSATAVPRQFRMAIRFLLDQVISIVARRLQLDADIHIPELLDQLRTSLKTASID